MGGLVLLITSILLVLVPACATAMRSTGCSRLPSVEECSSAALRIRDECLRACVIAQCSGVTVVCGTTRLLQRCAESRDGGAVGGFARSRNVDCRIPANELNWCDLRVPMACRPLLMVHELAHTCGWTHGDGMGVPGDRGELSWRSECE